MENFESELKSMILKWLKRGYSLEGIRDRIASTGQILDTLHIASDYLDAIKEGNKIGTDAISHHNI